MGDMADLAIDQAIDAWEMEDCGSYCEGCWACNEDPTVWYTTDGKKFKIVKLETRHLLNILNYVTRERKQSLFGKVWDSVKREAVRRGIIRVRAGNWKQAGTDRRAPDEKYRQFTTLM